MAAVSTGESGAVVLATADASADVVRHNKLIESKHTLSLTERRFILVAVGQINSSDEDFKTYSIGAPEFFTLCGQAASKDHYGDAVRLAHSLVQRSTLIRDDAGKRFSAFPWFHRISYGDGRLQWAFNSQLKPYLLQLKSQFTRLTLEYALLLDSVYAGRIYDLLKQYERVGARTIAVDDLRTMLELKDSYPNFADFRKRVLDVAEREINAKTDIKMAWKEVKVGKKVVSLVFQIRPNVPAVTMDSPEVKDATVEAVFKRLLRHGVKEKKARILVEAYPVDRICRNIEKVEAALRAKGADIKNGAGFVIKAIEEDWRDERSLFAEEENKAAAEVIKRRAKADKLARALEAVKEEYIKYEKMATKVKWRELSLPERARIEERVRAKVARGETLHVDLVGPKLERAIAGNTVEEDIFVWLCFTDVLREQYPDLKKSLIEFAREARAHIDIIAALEAEAVATGASPEQDRKAA